MNSMYSSILSRNAYSSVLPTKKELNNRHKWSEMDEEGDETFQSLKGKAFCSILNMLMEDHTKSFTLISRTISVKAVTSGMWQICPQRGTPSGEPIAVSKDLVTWFYFLFHFSYPLSSVFLWSKNLRIFWSSVFVRFVGKNIAFSQKPRSQVQSPGSLPC